MVELSAVMQLMTSNVFEAQEPAAEISVSSRELPNALRIGLASAALVIMWNFDWFVDLTDRNRLFASSEGSYFTQAMFLTAGTAMSAAIAWLGVDRLRPLMRWSTMIFVGWSIVTSLTSIEPLTAFRRLALFYIAAIIAFGVLVIVRSSRQFALVLSIGAGIILTASYFGVVFLPQLSIHSMYDAAADPDQPGLWRGIFNGKNDAGAAMITIAFVGLYVSATGYRLAGWAITASAAVFLLGSYSKTVLATMPAVFLAVALFEWFRFRWLRRAVIIGPLIFFSLVSLGSVIIPFIKSLLDAIMSDSSFTGRTNIWEFALQSIASRPIQGWGFGAFWGTARVAYGSDTDSWATDAAHAHNGYLDAALNMGLPGLAILLIVYIVNPLRDITTIAEQKGGVDPLSRLFLRIWMFGLLSSSFEPIFQNTHSSMCYMMFLSIFGLCLRAQHSPVF